MKKNLLIVISMMIVAVLATGCAKYESVKTEIKGTPYWFFTGLNDEGKIVYGIQTAEKEVIPAKYKNIVYAQEHFIAEAVQGKQFTILNNQGIDAAGAVFDDAKVVSNPKDSTQTYIAAIGQLGRYVFLPKAGKIIGPYEKISFTANYLIGQQKEITDVIKTDGNKALSGEFADLIIVKDEKSAQEYLLTKEPKAKTWVLATEKSKKLTQWAVNKMQKDAIAKWGATPVQGITVKDIGKY